MSLIRTLYPGRSGSSHTTKTRYYRHVHFQPIPSPLHETTSSDEFLSDDSDTSDCTVPDDPVVACMDNRFLAIHNKLRSAFERRIAGLENYTAELLEELESSATMDEDQILLRHEAANLSCGSAELAFRMERGLLEADTLKRWVEEANLREYIKRIDECARAIERVYTF